MRKRRQYSKTGLYHVVIRGVNKQNIFFDDDDRKIFLGLLKKYSIKYEIKIHAFCLMDNHVHLELEDKCLQISLFMQCVCSVYARYFNRRYDRIGHLFQERYASEIIDDDSYFLTVFRYILQNPQNAGLVKSHKYKWSSYPYYWKENSFVCKDVLELYHLNQRKMDDFLSKQSDSMCLEIELRHSEKELGYVEKIKKILKTENPIINPDLPKKIINEKIKLLKDSGLSIRVIVRTTGISKHLVQKA